MREPYHSLFRLAQAKAAIIAVALLVILIMRWLLD